MSWKTNVRYVPNRPGMAACAVGPELTAATKAAVMKAYTYASSISPEGREATGHPRYSDSFEVEHYIEDAVGYPHPWPRVGHRLVNTARHAIIVELGAPNTEARHVFRRTLIHLDATADD